MTLQRRTGIGASLTKIALVAMAFGLGFVLVYYVTVRTLQGRLFGDASLRGALLTRSTMADSASTVLTVVSAASLLGAVALVATIALVRLTRVPGLAAVGLLVGANLSTLLLKRYLLERPDLGLIEVSPATLNSLPSGHTTAVFSAFAALLLVVPTRWRYPLALVGLGSATVTALATMSAGWHRAGDSMAAFLLVGVWTAIAVCVIVLIDISETDDRQPLTWPASAKWLAAISVGSLALGLAMGAALDASGPIRDASLGSWIAFLVSGLLIVATGAAVSLGIVYLLVIADSETQVAP